MATHYLIKICHFLEHKDIYIFSTKSTKINGFIDAPTLFKEGIIKFHNYKGVFETSKSRGVNLNNGKISLVSYIIYF